MIVVDSSVWIDYFNGVGSRETDTLDTLLGVELVAVGDVILGRALRDRQKADGFVADGRDVG